MIRTLTATPIPDQSVAIVESKGMKFLGELCKMRTALFDFLEGLA